ncbi:MAG: glutamine--fructose-6-phosphate transaminase (isomerizing) [Candidatus Coproplasma sp.]
MCGIVGYVGQANASNEVYQGLLRLEYRGYDSAGVSVKDNGEFLTVKRAGRVERLSGDISGLMGKIAIGHTRWATHGEANDINAHPHVYGDFSVAHNGIIENYAELKEELIGRGDEFVSQTDSEVVPHLLNYYYCGECRGNLLSAIRRTAARLKGSYALAILCRDFDGVIAVKYKSSAIVGYGKDCNYIASDIPALVGKAERISVLEDGDIAFVAADNVETYSGTRRVERPSITVSEGYSNADLNGYPHYMLKEIGENPLTLAQTVQGFSCKVNRGALNAFLREADKIIFVGCGTAYNSALIGKRLLSKAYSCPCTAEIASELRYDPPTVTPKTLVIAVSQSGETADTVEAAELLKRRGARVVAITNAEFSAITHVAELVVPVRAGQEICVAATKSYIGQLSCFYMMSERGGQGMENSLFSTSDKIKKVISDGEYAATVAKLCAQSSAVFFLGRGIDYDVAVEGSLKLKEVSYVFSDGYPAGELKHGTLALVDKSVLAVVLICDERLAEKCENAVEQVLSRGGKAVVITTLAEVKESLKNRATVWLLPYVPTQFSPFLTATALQLIAYRTAVLRGNDPDKPRNLAKSVTVE